ncbi:MAG TPA: TetR family transcriptional regulator [Candidatus Baltobacteraceae bacterium]|nr:TetR family transcriptional regulator [Candidatus Baltobacteraceae bacterium]
MAGLRERKKEHVRTTIQREALRLFTEQGFEQTTVEQIAEAAGISPATFYRYFTSKEDSVVTDEYDPIVIQALMERPADEPAIDSVRAVMTGVLAKYFDRDRDLLAARHQLLRKTPSLQVASFEEQERATELFSALIARHLRRPANDLDVRIACGAVTGALREAVGLWFAQGATGGEQRIREVLNHAIDRVESALRF